MTKKRKPDATRLEEVDRSMYSTFCSAASSLSQLYTHAMHQQRLSFQAGEGHAMEKLKSWVLRQQQDGVRLTTNDILAYMQNEAVYGTEEPSSSPRQTSHHQQPSQTTATHSVLSGFHASSNAFSSATIGQGLLSGISDQNKNDIFSDVLSTRARQSFQQYHLPQGGDNANATQNAEGSSINQTRDQNPQSSDNTPMDMHADSPGRDFFY